jgi:hypothetical protein
VNCFHIRIFLPSSEVINLGTVKSFSPSTISQNTHANRQKFNKHCIKNGTVTYILQGTFTREKKKTWELDTVNASINESGIKKYNPQFFGERQSC